MFNHVAFGAHDLARLDALNGAAMAPLGLRRRWEGQDDGGPPGIGWAAPGTRVPAFFVQEPFDRRPASAGNGRMEAFLAPSPEAVRKAHAAGLAAGGGDEDVLGERPQHGRGYRGSHPRDPEGGEPHVVRRGHLAGS